MPLLELDELQAVVSRERDDVLSSVLRAVRLTGAVFFDNDARAPWVAATPSVAQIADRVLPSFAHVIPFHIVTSGRSWAWRNAASGEAVLVETGEVVMFPLGDEHTLASARGMADTPSLADWDRSGRPLPLSYRINARSEGEACRFVCGYLGCDTRPFNPLLDALPRMLHVRPSEIGRTLFTALVGAASNETAGNREGREAMLAHAAELLFGEVVRSYLAVLPKTERSWLSSLRDRHIGKALYLLHSRPAETWTVDRLARAVGLSRTVFAERFTDYVGFAPMAYLGRWRMQLAALRLDAEGGSVAQAAAEIGYESEGAFRRAFKRYVGATPGEWRQRSRGVRSSVQDRTVG